MGSTGFSFMLVLDCIRPGFYRYVHVFKPYISSDNPDPLLYSSYKILILGQCFCTVRQMRLNNIHFENSVFIMLPAEQRGVDLCE